MRFVDRYQMQHLNANVGLLLALVVFAWLNYATALDRSLITVGLDATVKDKRIAHEKHPGVDDAHLVTFDQDGKTFDLEVDVVVYESIQRGNQLEKTRGEPRLSVDGQTIPLEPSETANAMKFIALLFVGPALIAFVLRLIT